MLALSLESQLRWKKKAVQAYFEKVDQFYKPSPQAQLYGWSVVGYPPCDWWQFEVLHAEGATFLHGEHCFFGR
jgi:hypothetical protein